MTGNALPLFEVPKHGGVHTGAFAAGLAAPPNARRLDLRDLPNPPHLPSGPSPR